jgi:murein DD-endopeptidase MepM/ murein hydrolase activator NlpD
LKQTDLGPAPFTGRKIDVTYSALGKLGYNEANFPTDSQFKATYLGHTPDSPRPATLPNASLRGGTSASLVPAPSAPSRGLAMLSNLISQEKGAGTNPLLTTGALERNMVAPATTSVAPTPAPTAPLSSGKVGKLGGFLPANAQLKIARVDQGQDVQTNPGGPIIAPGDGIVVAVNNNPGGFGERYPVVKFTSGPMAGKSVYLGHTHSDLKVGDHFKAGQALSHTGYGTPKEGNARTPGWAEIGLASALSSGSMQEGRKIAPYLIGKR